MGRFVVATIWLVAVFPVLSLWRRNVDEVSRGDALVALVAACVLGTSVWAGARLVFRARAGTIVAAVAFLAGFFVWAPLQGWLSKAMPAWGAGGVAVVVAVALLGVGVVVARRGVASGVAPVLALLAAMLVAWELVGLAAALWPPESRQAPVNTAPAPRAAGASLPPDIHYMLLDGYARADVMRELYGYDNTPFLDALRRLGFHVADSSRANYVKTLHALSTVLNMAYVQETVPVPDDWQRSRRLAGSIQSNRVVHLLRQRGYTIHSFDTGYTPAEFSNPDFHHRPARRWSEFHAVLLRSTPLPFLLGSHGDLHARHRERLRFVLDALPRLEGTRPRFVFAHLLAPHPPFVVDRHGEAVDTDRAFGYYDGSDYMKRDGTVAGYRHDYAEQARWVSERVLVIVKNLLQAGGETPPIILLMSDHGPGSGLDWASLDDTDLRERFGILMALYLPGFETLELEDDLSPVNTFRLIFDLYFGMELGPIEHRSYYTWQSQPYHYFDVTRPERPRVNVPAPASGLGR